MKYGKNIAALKALILSTKTQPWDGGATHTQTTGM